MSLSRSFVLALLASLSLPLAAQAAKVHCPASVTGCTLAYDGSWPAQGQLWTQDTAYWTGLQGFVKIDLGAAVSVKAITVSLDNNDSYRILGSLDGVTWTRMMDVTAAQGEQGWGMDTFSTQAASPDYDPSLHLKPMVVRYLKVRALGGDGLYSVGEVKVHTTR